MVTCDLSNMTFYDTEGRKYFALTPLSRSNPFKFYVDCIFRIHDIRCCSLNNSGYRRGDVHLTVSAYFNFSTFFLSLPSTRLSYSSPIVILSIANIFYWFFFCSRMIGTSWVDPWMGNSDCGTSRRRRWPCGMRYPVSSPLPTSVTMESLLWPALTTENVSSTLQRWIPSYMNPNQSIRLSPVSDYLISVQCWLFLFVTDFGQWL